VVAIKNILNKYSKKLDRLDLELIIAYVLGKNREFVLSHPEYKLKKTQITNLKSQISRRINHEPLAYILGEKEFYGLKFKVNKNTLIPRPETEMMVTLAIKKILDTKYGILDTKIIDVGTGSGNILISLAHRLEHRSCLPAMLRIAKQVGNKYKFYGIDIHGKALAVAKQNAKIHRLDKKIKFLRGNLLNPIISNLKFISHNSKLIILANLPYLSPEIYFSCSKDIKKYEPKSALTSQKEGLAHYEKLFKQIIGLKQKCSMLHALCLMEISPEQKEKITKLIRKYFPKAKMKFYKDLSRRWRICELKIFNDQ